MNRRSTLRYDDECRRNNAPTARDPDRITNLPDGVITHILSKLPIKDAVRTCVLSKDWEFKWTFIHSLAIADEIFSDPWGEGNLFRNTVDKLLLHLNNVQDFYLFCECEEPIAIKSWISAVLRRFNIESVKLHIYDIHRRYFVLPRSLLSCTSLRNLVVDIDGCIFKVPAKSWFSNLRSLELIYVTFVNELSGIDTVTFTFPVLETLIIFECLWSLVKYVEFFAPSLTNFTTTSTAELTNIDDYSIKIIGSRLADFCIYGDSVENFVLTDTTVISAFLQPWSCPGGIQRNAQMLGEDGFQVRKLLRQISSSQYLKLTTYVLKAIVQSEIRPSLPRFSVLKELDVYYDKFSDLGGGGGGLLEILHASPFVEVLKIYASDLDEYDYDAIESAPYCILSHLEEIRSCYCFCKNPQFRLEKFLLNNAFELKYFRLSGCRDMQEEIVKQLSAFPKGSKGLQIVQEYDY